jgi:GTPase SAR1 family protein
MAASVEAHCTRGLDNAGKTTIVKKIMNEDVNSVSPTLGFIIKTIEYDGYVSYPDSSDETDEEVTN